MTIVFRSILGLQPGEVAEEGMSLNLLQIDAERLYTFAQLSHMVPVAIVTTAISGFHLTYTHVQKKIVKVNFFLCQKSPPKIEIVNFTPSPKVVGS